MLDALELRRRIEEDELVVGRDRVPEGRPHELGSVSVRIDVGLEVRLRVHRERGIDLVLERLGAGEPRGHAVTGPGRGRQLSLGRVRERHARTERLAEGVLQLDGLEPRPTGTRAIGEVQASARRGAASGRLDDVAHLAVGGVRRVPQLGAVARWVDDRIEAMAVRGIRREGEEELHPTLRSVFPVAHLGIRRRHGQYDSTERTVVPHLRNARLSTPGGPAREELSPTRAAHDEHLELGLGAAGELLHGHAPRVIPPDPQR